MMLLTTNLKSVFRLSRAVLRAMMKPEMDASSTLLRCGCMGNAGPSPLRAASKAGIMGYQVSRTEIGTALTVNCVAPGFSIPI